MAITTPRIREQKVAQELMAMTIGETRVICGEAVTRRTEDRFEIAAYGLAWFQTASVAYSLVNA